MEMEIGMIRWKELDALLEAAAYRNTLASVCRALRL